MWACLMHRSCSGEGRVSTYIMLLQIPVVAIMQHRSVVGRNVVDLAIIHVRETGSLPKNCNTSSCRKGLPLIWTDKRLSNLGFVMGKALVNGMVDFKSLMPMLLVWICYKSPLYPRNLSHVPTRSLGSAMCAILFPHVWWLLFYNGGWGDQQIACSSSKRA